MEIVVTGRHTQVKQRFRDVVETKMNRVTAIAPDAQRAQIVLTHEGNPRQADTAKRVEITVIAGRTVVRAEASSTDEFSALDMALDKLTLRLRAPLSHRRRICTNAQFQYYVPYDPYLFMWRIAPRTAASTP